MLFEKYCRLCATELQTNLLPLSSTFEKNLSIQSCLQKYLNLNIELESEVHLPQNICKNCLGVLQKASQLHRECHSSEGYFRLLMRLDVKQDHSYFQEIPESEEVEKVEKLEVEYWCATCDLTFDFEKNLRLHEKYFHPEKDGDEGERTDSDFVEHLVEQNVQNEDDSTCWPEVEGMGSEAEPNEVMVKNEVTNEIVTETFDNEQEHDASNSSVDYGFERPQKLPEISNEKEKCMWCNKQFYSLVALNKHTAKAHSNYEQEVDSTEIPTRVVCVICGDQFDNEKELENHEATRHKQLSKRKMPKKSTNMIPCEVCGKVMGRYGMQNHMLIHEGKLPFKCEICGRRFRVKTTLKLHMRMHLGKPFECTHPGCTKRFVAANVMRTHLRTHNKAKDFLCNVCGRTFNYNWALNRHVLTHAEIPQFECKYCNERFRTDKNLRRHIFKAHIGEPYQCPNCSKKFVEPASMRLHNLNIHKVDIGRDYTNYKIDVKYVYENYSDSNDNEEEINV